MRDSEVGNAGGGALPLACGALLCTLAMVVGCGDRDAERSVLAHAVSGVLPSTVGAAAASRDDAPGTESSAPADLRAAWVAAVQRQAGPAYDLITGASGSAYRAYHSDQRLRVRFDRAGLAVTVGGELTTLQLTRVGRRGTLHPVQPAELSARQNRVTYRRGPVTEWYVHGPLGIEQGFSLADRPKGPGRIELELAVGGTLVGHAAAGSAAVVFRRNDGAAVLRYGELFAWDVDGRVLPATIALAASGSRLLLRVDDRSAHYPVTIDPLVATQQAKLLASDGAAGDQFGFSVAVSDDTAVIGAWRDDDKGKDAGSAYVFVRSGTSWSQQAKLVPADGAAGDYFGLAVAVAGDTVIIGAPYDDDKGKDSGSAYVFVRSGTNWSQQAKLRASDGAAFDFLGESVALSGVTAILGADGDDDKGKDSGSAYLFVRSGTTWSQQAKLLASDGARDEQFGDSVAVSRDTAVIGAYGDGDKGYATGAAYVFARNGTRWSQQAKLLASDGASSDYFGCSVAVSQDRALIGAYRDDDKGKDSGAAYVFARNGTSWTQQAKLLASDGAAGDVFGDSVAVSGDTVVIGAIGNDDRGYWTGSAYVFVRSGTQWSQQAKLLASDAAAQEFFGQVALSGDAAVIGARGDDDNGSYSGSAYVFTLCAATSALADGATCRCGLQCKSGHCVDGVCCNTACGGGSTNDCQACSRVAGAAADGTCGPLTAAAASKITCRKASGPCDTAEVCSPSSTNCLADAAKAKGSACSAGPCAVAASCDGTAKTCPAIRFKPKTTICRSAATRCDQAETCSGTTASCPKDAFKPDGTSCSGGVCAVGRCVASPDAGADAAPDVGPDRDTGSDAAGSDGSTAAAPDASAAARLDGRGARADAANRVAPRDGGCDCGVGDRTGSSSARPWLWLLFGLWIVRRRVLRR